MSQNFKSQKEGFRCVVENISNVPDPGKDGRFPFRDPEPTLFKNY